MMLSKCIHNTRLSRHNPFAINIPGTAANINSGKNVCTSDHAFIAIIDKVTICDNFWGNITFIYWTTTHCLGATFHRWQFYFTCIVAGECFLQKTDISDTWPQIEIWHLDKRTISTAQRGAAGARRAAARWNRRQMLSYQRRKFWDRKH